MEKVRCTAVEKRKPLGIFSLAFCELAQGAPRRPPGAAGRLFLRYSASENRKIFEKNLIGVNFGIRVFGGWAGIQNRVNPEPGTRPDRQNGRTRTRTLKWGIFRHWAPSRASTRGALLRCCCRRWPRRTRCGGCDTAAPAAHRYVLSVSVTAALKAVVRC